MLLDEELSSREQFLNNYLLKKQEEKVSPGLSGVLCGLLVQTQVPYREHYLVGVTDSTLFEQSAETRRTP